jgi:hypothetical protein
MARASWTARWRPVCERSLSGVYRNLQRIICAQMKSVQIRTVEWENNYEIDAGRADSERSVVAPFDAMPSAAPPQLCRANSRVGHLPKPAQQRSDQAGKPVISEQDDCSIVSNKARTRGAAANHSHPRRYGTISAYRKDGFEPHSFRGGLLERLFLRV